MGPNFKQKKKGGEHGMVLLTSVTLSTPRGRATIIVRRHEEELWAPFGVGDKNIDIFFFLSYFSFARNASVVKLHSDH
jgi:hypothetical protein